MAKLGFAALCAAAALVPGAVAENTTDVSATGACKSEIESLCKAVQPGDGHLARCIRNHQAGARARKENNPVTPACRTEMAKLFMNISKQGKNGSHISDHFVNPVTGFRQACSKDMQKLCKDSSVMATTTCLKVHKPKLSEACKERLFSVQQHEANDARLDPALSEACRVDMASNGTCSVVFPLGAQLACLRANRKALQATCRTGLFMRDTADAEDIRLNVDVLETCKSEISSKCKDVQFGEARILNCLWEAMHKPSVDGFDGSCRDKVVKLTEQHLRDYRLDFQVRTHCEDDIKAVCATEKEQVDSMTVKQLFEGVDKDGLHHKGDSGSVLHCLKKNMDNLKNQRCAKQLTRLVRIEAVQFGTDVKLLSACRPSFEQFCSDERRQGMHKCLRKHIAELDPECREQELLQGSLESRDITTKPQVFFVCTHAMDKFCRGVDPGAAQMLHCLQDHRTTPNFPVKCGEMLLAELKASNHDFRFKHGLRVGCKSEIDSFCADVKQEGGGKVTSCLQDHYKNITNTVCRAEVARFIGQGLENIDLAPVLRNKCKDDVRYFCSDVPPGAGQVHKCLMGHRAELTTVCAEAMFNKTALQSQDITVDPGTMEACKTSINKYCKDVRFGGGRTWRCLEDHIKELPELCKDKVSAHMDLAHANFHLNPVLATYCRQDAKELCPVEVANALRKDFSSRGELVSCMIKHRQNINNTECKQSLFRKEKQRVEKNALDPMAKEACKHDVKTFCQNAQNIGRAQEQQCLQHHLAQLSPRCAEKIESYVVLAAGDIRYSDGLMKACAPSMKKFCNAVLPGGGRQISCLIDNKDKVEVDSSCRDLLVEQVMWRAKGLQFNPTLKKTCTQDLLDLLKGVKCDKHPKTEGWKIHCLTSNAKNLKNQDCKNGVSNMLKRQSADARMKPGFMFACRADAKALCPDVSPAEGRLQECMRKHAPSIMAASCKALVKEIAAVDSGSASMSYKIRKGCVSERAKFCHGIEAGDSRLLACLAANMKSPDFSPECRKSLEGADLKTALKKHPIQSGIEEIKHFIMTHRSFMEKYWLVFLVGTVCSLIIFCVLFARFILKKQMGSGIGWYSTVVPKDIETAGEQES